MSNNPNFTPGPWSIDDQGMQIAIAPRQNGRPQRYIAYVDKTHHGVACDANARLIAAAPDLLDALERLVNESYFVGVKSPEVMAAYAALVKAKGV